MASITEKLLGKLPKNELPGKEGTYRYVVFYEALTKRNYICARPCEGNTDISIFENFAKRGEFGACGSGVLEYSKATGFVFYLGTSQPNSGFIYSPPHWAKDLVNYLREAIHRAMSSNDFDYQTPLTNIDVPEAPSKSASSSILTAETKGPEVVPSP